MRFQSVCNSKRHAKFRDVQRGQIFFFCGFTYMRTEEVEGGMDEYIRVNAVQLDGVDIGELVYIENEEDVSILTETVVINYNEDNVKSWI